MKKSRFEKTSNNYHNPVETETYDRSQSAGERYHGFIANKSEVKLKMDQETLYLEWLNGVFDLMNSNSNSKLRLETSPVDSKKIVTVKLVDESKNSIVFEITDPKIISVINNMLAEDYDPFSVNDTNRYFRSLEAIADQVELSKKSTNH